MFNLLNRKHIEQKHLLTNLFYSFPYRLSMETVWFDCAVCTPHKKKLVEWLAGLASIQRNQTLYWSYYSWMDKEQTKRQYQYMTKKKTLYIVDSHRETANQVLFGRCKNKYQWKKRRCINFLNFFFHVHFSVLFVVENRWHAQNNICGTGCWCWTVCVHIFGVCISTPFLPQYTFICQHEFPTK